jgi:antitoxin component YwqK of YwqJK toxin-antitoxin module
MASVFVLISIQGCQFVKKEKKEKVEENLTPGVDGVQHKKNKAGILISSIEHKNGKRHGISRFYYEDGKTIHKEIKYIRGRKEGITRLYYKSGKLYYTVNYKKGKRNGLMRKYYESGIQSTEMTYIDGKPQPGLIEYNTKGKRKKLYPKIIFEEIDKTATENKYILRISLTKGKRKVDFSRIVFDQKGNEIGEAIVKTNNGVGKIEFNLPDGGIINQKIKIKAVYITPLRNYYIIYKEKRIKAEW